MPFPIHPPKQMPCPHWQHFPISPVDSKPAPFGSSNNDTVAPVNKPPEPVSYRYCAHCKAAGKDVGDISKD
ncbi:uncharacterized protein LOC115764371 [Drosophila novamexicana]|uniref:uncharacterized protein LOC115764371 n=1 Tax=Drosophila novamexicana TaxID=47314 RepID=UPI0011E5E67A|nr:uncharacterized protein LOC115764371 [Drosophila novamexicana]